jgi:phospholipid/cholesterol/gamma-HCH transport system substrate-binding protein
MKRNIRVGLFVLAGLFFSGLVIFLIGDQRRLFERHVEMTTTFKDVQGLKSGAPIRMGGVDIGQVTEVGYRKDPGDSLIYVKLSVVSTEADRIRTDSVVKVAAKGLLGDKMIEITRGSGAPAPRDKPLTSEEPSDMFGAVGDLAADARGAMKDVRRVTDSLANEQLQSDLRNTVAHINAITKQIAEGDGYPHKLLTDKDESERISNMLRSIDRTANEASAALAEVRMVAARVRSGPGFTHEIIYGEGPQKEVAAFGFAADELGRSLKGIRESDSFVHDALYGGKGSGAKAIDNMVAITDDLRAITAGVRAGKGTVGALLVDPSVYEDMKVVLGNVERNDVLRALVRYSIKQDEKKPTVTVGAQR